MNKKIFEALISDLNSHKGIKYGKSRVAGSIKTTYYMHSRSASMPGQKDKFTVTSSTQKNYSSHYPEDKLISAFKRDKYILSKNPIGIKYYNNYQSLFTYQEFTPYDDETLKIALKACYKQIYGNFYPMDSERPIDLERRLRNGDIPIRDFIRALAKSEFYIKNYYESFNQENFITLSLKHILGRPIINQSELIKNIEILNSKGFEYYIDSLVDSLEYQEIFGDDIVPYTRNWNSPVGSRTSNFIKTVAYTKGYASSDNVIKDQQLA